MSSENLYGGLEGGAPPQITLADLEAMNLWCLSYKSKVRSGQVPTPEEDARYLTFLPFLHHTGYAYDHGFR